MDPVLVNGNTLPSESWNTKAFFSKQFMAQRIVEIAFCTHVLGRIYADADTADGTFMSRIRVNSRDSKYAEFKRKRIDFLVMMKGAGYLQLSTDSGHHNGDKYMCFCKFFDPQLGCGLKSLSIVIGTYHFFDKVSASLLMISNTHSHDLLLCRKSM